MSLVLHKVKEDCQLWKGKAEIAKGSVQNLKNRVIEVQAAVRILSKQKKHEENSGDNHQKCREHIQKLKNALMARKELIPAVTVKQNSGLDSFSECDPDLGACTEECCPVL